ncbi:MAG: ATP phosphoribosyltransferase, partial [Desulfoplanes sp.]
TIAHLYNSDWLSIEVVVDISNVRELIPRLQKVGAEAIIEFALNKVV